MPERYKIQLFVLIFLCACCWVVFMCGY